MEGVSRQVKGWACGKVHLTFDAVNVCAATAPRFGRAASPIMFIISAFSCTNAADAQCEPCGNLPAPRCSKARPGKPSIYMDTVTATTSSSSVKPKLVSTCREGSHLGGRTKIRPSSDPQVGERQGTDLLVPYHPLLGHLGSTLFGHTK